jgi:hypothetical protein
MSGMKPPYSDLDGARDRVLAGHHCAARLTGLELWSNPSTPVDTVVRPFQVQSDIAALERATDDAMGLRRGRPYFKSTSTIDHVQQGKRLASVQMASLHRPTMRPWQPATPDGRVSYYFEHTSISKVDSRTVGFAPVGREHLATGTNAADHGRYVERGAAVANRQMEAKETGIDLGLEIDGREYGDYIEREKALAEEDGAKILYQNIADSKKERAKFWTLVEEHERKPGKDQITVRYRGHEKYWEDIAAKSGCLDPGWEEDPCPDYLKDLIDKARENGEEKGEIPSSEDLRRWLYSRAKHWRAVDIEETGGRSDVRDDNPGQWHDARCGRVQMRVVGALPACLSIQAIDKIAAKISVDLTAKRVPHVLAVHAPSYDNDPDNWHFHLAYYDRPCARLSTGVWDFAQKDKDDKVQETPLKYGANRAKGIVGKERKKYPYRQDKIRELSDRNWVKKLRQNVVDHINVELEREGHQRRYHAGKGEEIGLPTIGATHLGPDQDSAKLLGVSTIGDTDNEQAQDRAKRQFFAQLRDMKVATANKWFDDTVDIEAEDGSAKCFWKSRNQRREAAEYELLAESARHDLERVTSRPDHLIRRLPRFLTAIASGTASKKDVKLEQVYRQRLEEAREALVDVASYAIEQSRLIAQLESRARECDRRATELKEDGLTLRRATELAKIIPAKETSPMSAAKPGDVPPAPLVKPSIAPSVDVAKQSRPLATPHALDRWLQTVVEKGRLLERRADGAVIPIKSRPGDEAILRLPTFRLLKPALDRLFVEQTKEVDAATSAIVDRAKVPEVFLDGDRGWHIRALRPTLAALIGRVLDHPRVIDALFQRRELEMVRLGITPKPRADVDKPVAADLPPPREHAPLSSTDSQAPKHVFEPTTLPERTEQPKQPATSVEAALDPAPKTPHVSRPSDPVKSPVAYAFHGAMERIKDEGFQILQSTSGFGLSPDDLAALGLNKSIIAHPDAQLRLEKQMVTQERYKKRIVGYAERYPEKLSIVGKFARFSPDSDLEVLGLLDQMRANTPFHDRLRQLSEVHEQKQAAQPAIPEVSKPHRVDETTIEKKPARRFYPGLGNGNGQGF